MSRHRPTPIKPRIKDEKAYRRAINKAYVAPMLNGLRDKLAQAVAASQAYKITNDYFAGGLAQPVRDVPVGLIQQWLDRVRGYHKSRLIRTFRSALGVDISPVLTEPEIDVFMRATLAENVALIKTIPPRAHASLIARMEKMLADKPFDQNLLMQTLHDEYKSTGYNLRRITRDQTSKAIGNLTEIRQRQMGVAQYQWLTSQDERVRPSHRDLSDQVFAWDDPPPEGHPGQPIQCRCNASPILTEADARRIEATAKAARN